MVETNSHNPSKILESLSELREMVSYESIKKQPYWAKNDLEKMKIVVERCNDCLNNIEEVLYEYQLSLLFQDPTVYIARTTDTKTDIEYFTAKTIFRQRNGNKKEIKIYLGKASDFKNDTKSS